MVISEIESEALSLSPTDQAELLSALLESPSLIGAVPHDSDMDSLTEARIRAEEITSGKVKPLTKEQFLEGLR